jgi:hypothetical protein
MQTGPSLESGWARGSVKGPMRHIAVVVVAAGLMGIFARSSAAQTTPTAVIALQGLTFGTLTAGLAEPVRLNEAWRRAEARLEGERNLEVRLILPTALVAPGGASIPLQFVNGDASVTIVGSNQPSVFDPNTTKRFSFKKTETAALLYLGGTALPAVNQAAGNYTATVVIVLSKPGV